MSKTSIINKIIKFRDPTLETMSYGHWAAIPQNKLVEDLDPKQAKMLYEQDMLKIKKARVEKTQSFKDLIKENKKQRSKQEIQNFKDLIKENKKQQIKQKLKIAGDFKVPFDKKKFEEAIIIREINEILKLRDPILETMSYENWLKILPNKMIAGIDERQAKALYEQDMFRAEKVQASRVGRSSAGGGVRKRKTAAATFKPSDLEGLSLWLDADDASTITESGGSISAWTNKAPAPYAGLFDFAQASASDQPTLVASGQNGRSVVRFDAAKNEHMEGEGSASVFSPAASNDEITVFAVLRYTTGYGGATSWGDRFLSWSLKTGSSRSGYLYATVGEGGATGISFSGGTESGTWVSTALDPAHPITDAHQIVVYRNQLDGFRIDGVDGFPDNGGTQTAPLANAWIDATHKYILLGGEYVSGGSLATITSFAGDICEIICYADNLPDSDCETVEAYLATKWGITLS